MRILHPIDETSLGLFAVFVALVVMISATIALKGSLPADQTDPETRYIGKDHALQLAVRTGDRFVIQYCGNALDTPTRCTVNFGAHPIGCVAQEGSVSCLRPGAEVDLLTVWPPAESVPGSYKIMYVHNRELRLGRRSGGVVATYYRRGSGAHVLYQDFIDVMQPYEVQVATDADIHSSSEFPPSGYGSISEAWLQPHWPES